jgi:DNA polymerase
VLSLVAAFDGHAHVWLPTLAGLAPRAGWQPSPLDLAGLRAAGVDPARLSVYAGPTLPPPVADAVASGRPVVAHNALNFDRFVWERFLPDHPVAAWADSLYAARAAGFPGSLDKLGAAAVGAGKDQAKRLIQRLWRVRQYTETDGSDGDARLVTEYPPLAPGMVGPLVRYNTVDVTLMRALWEGPLADVPVEGDVVAAHAAVNERGVCLDLPLVRAVQAVAAESVSRAGDRIKGLVGDWRWSKADPKQDDGFNWRSVPQLKEWLASKGVRVTDHAGNETLRKEAMERCLANPDLMLDGDSPVAAAGAIDPAVFQVLRLRAAGLRITQAKAQRAIDRVSPDGRVRDLFSYHQAHTGRWSSSGIQVHNLPRAKKGARTAELLADFAATGWGMAGDAGKGFERVTATLGDGRATVDDALGALVRPCFTAAPGHALLVCDYAAVEARGIAWIAGQQDLLDTFAAGEDVYLTFGRRLFGRELVRPADDDKRQVAKVTVLGSGYGLGAEKMGLYCAAQGVDLAAAGVTPEQCVDAYRAAYPEIAGGYAGVVAGRPYRAGGVWTKLDQAAKRAITDGGTHEAGRCRWGYRERVLRCELPSGRVLHYRDAKVEDVVPGYVRAMGLPEKAKPTVTYLHPMGYRAAGYGGKWAENVVQAVCRDLLASALVRCEAAGLPVVLHVHDELVCEAPAAGPGAAAGPLRRLAELMSRPPPWAAGFPVAVEGHAAPRYLKAAPPGWPTVEARDGVVS